MIGVLVITHEDLGDHLIRCATHVMGEKPTKLEYLSVFVHHEPDEIYAQAQSLIHSLNSGTGVLVFSDMYGATPCNIAARLVNPGVVECVSGVNLPMLIRTLTYRNEPLSVVVEKALSGGKDGIQQLGTELSNAV